MDDPNAPGNSLVTNIDKTTHTGVEALVGSSFAGGGGHRIEPQVSVTLNRFRFDDDPVYGTNRLPAAPAYAARGEVLYKHAGGFYAGPTFDFIGTRYVDFANSYTVDRFGLMGIRAGFSGRAGRCSARCATSSMRTISPPSVCSMWPRQMRESSIRVRPLRSTPAFGIRFSIKMPERSSNQIPWLREA